APNATDLSADPHRSSVPNLEPTLEKQEKSPGQRSKIPSFYPIGLGNKSATRIKAWTKLAIRNDPLNASAFGILARVSDIGTDKDQTRRLMQAAVRRSLHETLAVSWMMLASYQNEDYHAALSYADVLLRTSPGFFTAAMPILGSIAETK